MENETKIGDFGKKKLMAETQALDRLKRKSNLSFQNDIEEDSSEEDTFGPPIPNDFKVPSAKPPKILSQESDSAILTIDEMV